jgi:hypothetical protein
MVSEPCFYGGVGYGSNNHQAAGMNLVAMDGSGKWIGRDGLRPVVFGNGPPYMGANRYGVSGMITQYVPNNYWFCMNYYGTWVTRGDTNTDERYWQNSASSHTDLWFKALGFSSFNF